VVGHQHVGVADIAVGGERVGHIHVALDGEGLHEVELAPFDVAEMHIEYLAALAEPADHAEDLAGRIVEHLGDGVLAEIEPGPECACRRQPAMRSPWQRDGGDRLDILGQESAQGEGPDPRWWWRWVVGDPKSNFRLSTRPERSNATVDAASRSARRLTRALVNRRGAIPVQFFSLM